MAGVGGGWRQASYFLNQHLPAHPAPFIYFLAFDQFGDRRSAGHGWNAAFGAKAYVSYTVVFRFCLVKSICFVQSKGELQNVSAGGIFQSSNGVGRFNLARVSRVLEMVENFGGVHLAIVIRGTRLSAYASHTIASMSESHYPRRIACLQPSATVILANVGELDRVVACTKYCVDVVPELRIEQPVGVRAVAQSGAGSNAASDARHRDRMIVADSWTSKSREILAAKPDLVIAAVPYQEAAVVEILKAGIRFLGLAPRTLDDIYTDIALISGCVGATDRGAKVISAMQTAIEEMRRQTASLPRRRVFCEEWGKPVIASQPWVAELVDAAGGEFLGTAGAQCSAEEIARLDPEVIVAAWCGAGDRVPLAKIASGRGWEPTTAVRNAQVYCIADELLNTPAPTLISGLRALAGAIHPATFGAQPGLRSIAQGPVQRRKSCV
jgi:iron complex transport system substrate-binding protein